jgi:phosphoserine phosphatase RsbU/P
MSGPNADEARTSLLEPTGPMIGAVEDMEYATSYCPIDAFAKLFLYSDGIYEIEKTDGKMWSFEEFLQFLDEGPASGESSIERLIAHVRSLSGRSDFVDDFSMIEFRFEPPA